MEFFIGGVCQACSFDRMFQINSTYDHQQLMGCPNCSLGNVGNKVGFRNWSARVISELSIELAYESVRDAGIAPDPDRDPERDPYWSLVRDMTKHFTFKIHDLTENNQRLLLLAWSQKKNRTKDHNVFIYPEEMVEDFLSTKPVFLILNNSN
ncbi:MAG TPA: hypothetical protein VGQ59_11905 [Cyclobacteriaceae bacterium]|jgi:hypothetical protein|nr:hypothetical protein [Cyclobacteriaceae bacterium]